jgi:hypothetical protein
MLAAAGLSETVGRGSETEASVSGAAAYYSAAALRDGDAMQDARVATQCLSGAARAARVPEHRRKAI